MIISCNLIITGSVIHVEITRSEKINPLEAWDGNEAEIEERQTAELK